MVAYGSVLGQLVDDHAMELIVLGILAPIALEPLDELWLHERASVNSVDHH